MPLDPEMREALWVAVACFCVGLLLVFGGLVALHFVS